jgi:hypothetical protein
MKDYDNNLTAGEPILGQYEDCKAEAEYKPSNQQALLEYEINIRFLSRGCIVQVGCKNIAFETAESAMKEINEYVNNTYETQQKWRKLLDM